MSTRLMQRRRPALFALLLLLSILPRAACAIGEVSGRLGGVAQFAVGKAKAPAARIPTAVARPNRVRGPRTTTTNDDGSYMFQSLPPGTYELSIRVDGFRAVERRGIVVLAAQLAPVDILLEQGLLTETTTIVEKRNPVLNPESAVATTAL